MNVAYENDVKVPEEIGVAGFQNTKYARLARPQLSCVDVPIYDLGAVGMRLLTKLMNKEEVENRTVKLPHSIVLRKTTLQAKIKREYCILSKETQWLVKTKVNRILIHL